MSRMIRVLSLVVFVCAAALGETSVHSALAGVVSSDADGPMEGVVVSAK